MGELGYYPVAHCCQYNISNSMYSSISKKIERESTMPKKNSNKVFYTHFNTNQGYEVSPYWEDVEPIGVITVCHQINQDNVVSAGFSFCAPTDQFCRAVGRQAAKARMEVGDSYFMLDYYPTGNSPSWHFTAESVVSQAQMLLNHFIDTKWKYLPAWLKKQLNNDEFILSIRVKRVNRIARKSYRDDDIPF